MLDTAKKDRARFVSRMFGRIAGRYDLGNRVLSLGRDQAWRRRAIAVLAPRAHERILDLGAGTADLAILLAPLAGQVIAADFSRPMLEVGRAKARKARVVDGIAFSAADALQLPFRDSSFDGAITAFTVRNFERLDDGLREACRILKAGGRLVCLEFMRPSSSLVNLAYRPYLRHILPRVGGLVAGDAAAYRYLAESIAGFSTPRELESSLKDAGFACIDYQLLNLGTVAIHAAWKGGPAERGVAG